jgi:hypothetical protein
MSEYLVLTPINKNKKSKSNIDYREQLERVSSGEFIWCWDDSQFNNANVGEYFGFYFYGIKVVIHKITAVKETNERLPSWSSNVGQGNRKVIELTEPIEVIDWKTWISIRGAKRCMGTYKTTNLLKNHPLLYYYLRFIENAKNSTS